MSDSGLPFAKLAASVLTAAALVGVLRQGAQPVSSIASGLDLASILGDYRVSEARLTGFPAHVPCTAGSPARCSPLPEPTSRAFRSLNVLGRELRHRNDLGPEGHHARGIWYLFWAAGRDDQRAGRRALEALDTAVSLSPRDADVLADDAAAHLIAGELEDEPLDTVRALEAAERALSLRPDHETALFNRALALTRLHLGAAAIAAWDDFLRAVPPPSAWAIEAEQRRASVETLEGKPSGQDFPTTSGPARAAEVVRFGRRNPGPAAEYAEDELVPAWASAVLAGNQGKARAIAADLENLGKTLLATTGDPMVADLAVDLGHGGTDPPALARAARNWTSARQLNDRRETEAASELFRRVEPALQREARPLAFWSAYYRSVCAYFAGLHDDAKRRLEALGYRAEARGYRRAQGYVHWMLGLLLVDEGRLSEALEEYRVAATHLEEVGLDGQAASLRSLIADALLRLGEARGAFKVFHQAWPKIARSRDPKRRKSALWTAARAVAASGHRRTALLYYDLALSAARDSGLPAMISEVFYARAELLHEAGERERARTDLEEARRWLDAIRDRRMHRMVEARIAGVEGRVLGRRELGTSLERLTEAVDYFASVKAVEFLPQLLLDRAHRYLEDGDSRLAEEDLVGAIEIAERQRDTLPASTWRVSFATAHRHAIEELLRLRLDADRPIDDVVPWTDLLRDTGAFARGDELERARGIWPEVRDLPLPGSAALVSYSLLEDRLVIWTLRSGQMSLEQVHVKRQELRAWIDQAARSDPPPAETADARAWLYDRLIAPIETETSGAEEIYIAPDLFLYGLPFSALVDRDTGDYLIQRHALALTPSAALFLASVKDSPRPAGKRPRSILVVGNPQPDTALPSLPLSEVEAATMASLYPHPKTALLVAEEATRENLLLYLGTTDIFHFAGHAVVQPDDPSFSRLVLSGNSPEQPAGLFASEIRQLDLRNTKLVILSACSTAWARDDDSSGVLSLAAPFLAAGSSLIVASRQDIVDGAGSSAFTLTRETASSAPIMKVIQSHLIQEILAESRSGASSENLTIITTKPRMEAWNE